MADRNKVTLRKLARQHGAQPTMLDILQNNEQHRLLFDQYANENALARQQRQELRAGARAERQSILDQRRLDMAGVAAAANERGVLGSSMDFTARQDVAKNARLGLQSARATRNQGLIQNWADVMRSRQNYEMGVLGLQQNVAASRASGNAQNLLNNVIQQILGGGAGGGRDGGRGNQGGGDGGSGGFIENLGPLRNLSRGELNQLSPQQLDTLKSVLRKRVANRVDAAEDRYESVYKQGGRYYGVDDVIHGVGSPLKGINKLLRTKRRIKDILAVAGGTGQQQ